VPNLTWKTRYDVPQINPLSHVLQDLDEGMMDHSFAVRAAVRKLNLFDNLPFSKWLKYPIMAAATCRGCTQSCAICGGSRYSYDQFYGRKKIAFRSPENLARVVRRITRITRGPVFILGDIRQAGREYARTFLKEIQGIDTQIILEFFWAVDKSFMEEIGGALPNFFVQLSPESHDTEVLHYSGRAFSQATIKSSIQHILSAGCKRIDLFFMTGLPGQTYKSVLESVEYCRNLLFAFDGEPNLKFFISPLAPFLDPGSLAYERPEHYGYKILCRTLEDYRNALTAPSWKYILSRSNISSGGADETY
jgi:B12-binding domain/radical SAM domain protein